MLRRSLARCTYGMLLICAASVLLMSLAWVGRMTRRALAKSVPRDTATPLPTLCPQATSEPLWVEPVLTQTDLLTQTVVVWIGNGEAVTVTAESGLFAKQGDFDAYAHPACVEISLWPQVTHHLTVYGKVKKTVIGDCVYGGYTLSTRRDRYGAPLVIQQYSETGTMLFLPVVTVPGYGFWAASEQ